MSFERLAKETQMEMISNTVEFVALLALAAWLGAPSARLSWVRYRTQHDDAGRAKRSPDISRSEG